MAIENTPVNSNQVDAISVIDGEKVSLIDLATYNNLIRADFLKDQMLTYLNKVKTGNDTLHRLDKIVEKSRIAENDTSNYQSATWNINGDTITLSNGYSVNFDTTEEGIQLIINDSNKNQMLYSNGVLIPTPAGKAVDALDVGIPIMSDVTLVLGDGTSVTFTTAPSEDPFDPADLSGGLAQVTNITIKRGNQSIKITDANTGQAAVNPAVLNADLELLNYGHVLLENDGLDSWEYNGNLVEDMTYEDSTITSDTITGLFARKNYFKDSVSNNNLIYGAESFLTADDKSLLAELGVNYSDVSGQGLLTETEWKTLQSNALDKKSSLVGTSQYDYIALQRATANFTTVNEFLVSFNKNNISLLKEIYKN